MLKNYFLITIRRLTKQKLYAFINIFGLAVSIAFCTLIFLYVNDELTFDRFHEQGDRIYRVTSQSFSPDGSIESEFAWQPMPLAEALGRDLPEVEETVRFMDQQLLVRYGDRTFEEPVLFADPAIFRTFTFPLEFGQAATALSDINSVVLSPEAAYKYFGDENPVGKTIEIRFDNVFHDMMVTGVVEEIPGNSSISFEFLMPFDKLPATYEWIRNRTDRWNASSFYVYAMLTERASYEAAEGKLAAFRATYMPDETARLREQGRWEGDGPARAYHFQPLTEIHMDPSVRGGISAPSDPKYSYILTGIALAILLIACINFTTLAIGRSAGRVREVGVRKVVGALRRQLMVQFWGEAVLMSLLALILGLVMASLFLPTFNTLASKSLQYAALDFNLVAVFLVGVLLVTGLLAGSYPALVFSTIRPIEMLRKRLNLGGASALTRTLVVIQFGLSIFLVAGTFPMLQQLDHLQSTNLGYNKNHVVVIPTQDIPGDVLLERFQNEVGSRAEVLGITAVSSSFTRGYSREGWDYKGNQKSAYTYRVASNYLDVLEMELIEGRNLDPNLTTDSSRAVLVNEALVRDFGWANPIGEELTGFYENPIVVGVFKDVNFLSLHQSIEPMILTLGDEVGGYGHLLARIAPGSIITALEELEATWQAIVPDLPFLYTFLDDDLSLQYENEKRWSRIIGYSAVFAILIACLGLFGLTALTVAGRTKEIGIRKVLGASVSSVTLLLSREFARLVLIAIVFAIPAAYVAINKWLEGFAYRIELSWEVFALAGVAALGVALVTVSWQVVRAALSDPVKSLRYE